MEPRDSIPSEWAGHPGRLSVPRRQFLRKKRGQHLELRVGQVGRRERWHGLEAVSDDVLDIIGAEIGALGQECLVLATRPPQLHRTRPVAGTMAVAAVMV